MTKRRLPPELEEKGETDFNVGLTGDHSERWFSRTDILDWLEHLCGYREENERLRAALERISIYDAAKADTVPYDEWAEADAFRASQEIARIALNPETQPMTERQLPPALQEKVKKVKGRGPQQWPFVYADDLLDWLYGGYGEFEPGLVERVQKRYGEGVVNSGRPAYHAFFDALRAELAAEASEALDRLSRG